MIFLQIPIRLEARPGADVVRGVDHRFSSEWLCVHAERDRLRTLQSPLLHLVTAAPDFSPNLPN